MKAKIIILITVAFLIIGSGSIFAQSLRFERTDVDKSRNSFVTATYIFGVDIYADSLRNCSNVAFELKYDQTKFVRFSEWKRGRFGSKSEAFVLPISVDDGTGRIVVSSGSGNPPDTLSPDNPLVIHLEFAVIPTAIHDSYITFDIIEPRATVYEDSIPKIIKMKAQTISYKIHSYIDVWPGDADNSGAVDHLDFATVSYYLGMGPKSKSTRCFKRDPASTLWSAQAVIAWDSAAATYADCDGNGEVNMADNLVVTYNYDKKRTSGIINQEFIDKSNFNNKPIISSNSIKIPIKVNSSTPFIGVSGKIDLNQLNGFKIIGMEKANLFSNDNYFDYTINNDFIEFFSSDLSKISANKGTIAYLLIEPIDGNTITPSIYTGNMKGITDYGYIFDLSFFTSIEDPNGPISQEKFIQTDNYIQYESANQIFSYTVYDMNSRQLINENVNGNALKFDTHMLNSGSFILLINSEKGIISRKFLILK